MMPIKSGSCPYKNYVSRTNKNFFDYSVKSRYKKEQMEYSYFELEKVFGPRKASFINRLNYWLSRCGRSLYGLSGKWMYNPIHKWAEQLNCSSSTIKRLIKSLEEQEILLSNKVNAKKYNQTKWYSLNYKLLQSILKVKNVGTRECKKKWTSRLDQNEPINRNNNRNIYTNTSSNVIESNYSVSREERINLAGNLKEEIVQQQVLTPNENKLVKKIVEVWNKIFSYSISPIKAYMSKNNRKILLDVLKNHFAGNLSEWQEYAKKVNSSQFLMGEKKTKKNFKAVFSWLIQESTVESIKSGGYGVGDRRLDMDNISENKEKQRKEIVYRIEKTLEKQIKQSGQRKIFEEYVKKGQWQEDGDKYGISRYFGTYISPNKVLYDINYQAHYNMCLKEYVARKYHGVGMTGIRKMCIKTLQEKGKLDEEILIQKKRGL